MQYRGSHLENLFPLWNRERLHPMHQPKFNGLRGRDVNVLGASVDKQRVGNCGPLAQDIFGARVVSQGAVKMGLERRTQR